MGDWVKDSTKKGWLTSIFELGAWCGCLYSGFIAETLSRKYAIMLNVCIFVVGVIIQVCAVKAGHAAILGGRFVTGKHNYLGDLTVMLTDCRYRGWRTIRQCPQLQR